ncbi:MAG: membrane integrity-associated transporter subunit PqiC [Betaproteobacteria bacterium]|nr:membrane integrity-associated transporter subunit PqiC [Betaproteobacteria bacterium]
MDNGFGRVGAGRNASALFAALACAMLLAACGSTPVARYYTLSAVRDSVPQGGASVLRDKVIGIGPVVLPEYLDRPQVVIRASSNRVELADGHRWAEPLADSFSRVLRENLSLLLGPERVLSHASVPSARGDYQLMVQVLRFEGTAAGPVSLVASWSVVARDGAVLVAARRSSFEAAPSGTGIEALVAAQSDAVAQLSRQVAAALTSR